jgi:hypothetical protein
VKSASISLCGFLIFCAPAAGAFGQDTEGLRALLKTVDAVAGQQKVLEIDNYEVTTQSRVASSSKWIDMEITETIQFPDRTRQVFHIGAAERTQALDGALGWKRLEGEKTSLSEIQRREMERALFRDTFAILQHALERSLEVHLAGQEVTSSDTTLVLEIRGQQGNFFALHLDAVSYLPVKKTYQGGAEVSFAKFTERYSDYKQVDGIWFPYSIVVETNGETFIKSVVRQVYFNKKLRPDFFLD